MLGVFLHIIVLEDEVQGGGEKNARDTSGPNMMTVFKWKDFKNCKDFGSN